MPSESGSEGVPHHESGRLGDFELVREIGRGGSGTVWEAWQTSLRRLVALKLLAAAWARDERARERFLAEAQAGARLKHPGIVAVYAVGEHDGTLYIAQELIEGSLTLADRLDQTRRAVELPPDHYRSLAQLFAEVADALAAAHEAGIVHRDVKPSNILLAPDGRPKVADFGIAHIVHGPAISWTGDVLGTPFYMSPEQIAGKRGTVTRQTDVFSLGATLYEALTFTRPFDGDTSQLVMRRILSEEPLDPRLLRSKVPSDLAVICLKALEKAPAHRYATMGEFAADIRRYLADEPILARPPSRLALAVKWARRHPVVSTSGSVVLIALAVISGLLVLVSNEARRASNAEKEALASAKQALSSAATAEETLQYIVDLIGKVDPASPLNSRTIEELLTQGLTDARSRFHEEPRALAKLLHGFGKIFFSLGKFQLAHDCLTEAVESHRAMLGEGAVATVEAEVVLGACLIQLGRPEEADDEFKRAAEHLKLNTHQERLAALQLTIATANLRFHQKRLDDARILFERALADQDDLLKADDPNRQIVLGNLGVLNQEQGRLAEAERILRKLVELRRRVLPEGSVLTMNTLNSLGLVCRDQKQLEEAEALFREASAGFEASLPKGHPYRHMAINNLADVLVRQERFEEAEPLARSVFEARKAIPSLGPGHEHTLLSQEILTRVLDGLGRREEAMALGRDLLQRTPANAKEHVERAKLVQDLEARPIEASSPRER